MLPEEFERGGVAHISVTAVPTISRFAREMATFCRCLIAPPGDTHVSAVHRRATTTP